MSDTQATSPYNEYAHAAATHPGHKRPHNEDAYIVEADLDLYLVADGMGGHEAGEVASRIAVEQVLESLRDGHSLTEAVEAAHQAILRGGEEGEGRPGMGTTVVAARFDDDDFEVVWVGDSRAYRFNGEMERLTQDHSMVQELIASGRISEAEARVHPDRSLITRALGMQELETIAVDRISSRLAPGECLLLCSDGLSEELTDEHMAEIMREHAEPQAAVDALIESALDAGGRDNVTVVMVRAPERPAGFLSVAAWCCAALLAVAGGLAAWLYWRLMS